MVTDNDSLKSSLFYYLSIRFVNIHVTEIDVLGRLDWLCSNLSFPNKRSIKFLVPWRVGHQSLSPRHYDHPWVRENREDETTGNTQPKEVERTVDYQRSTYDVEILSTDTTSVIFLTSCFRFPEKDTPKRKQTSFLTERGTEKEEGL